MEGGAGLFLVPTKLKNETKNTINHSNTTHKTKECKISSSNENSIQLL